MTTLTRIECERLEQCRTMDCPMLPDCKVKWGHRCVKQFGVKVPRLQPGAYRRARERLRVPVTTERIGTLGTVIYLRHPMQETFESVVSDE